MLCTSPGNVLACLACKWGAQLINLAPERLGLTVYNSLYACASAWRKVTITSFVAVCSTKQSVKMMRYSGIWCGKCFFRNIVRTNSGARLFGLLILQVFLSACNFSCAQFCACPQFCTFWYPWLPRPAASARSWLHRPWPLILERKNLLNEEFHNGPKLM